MTLRADIWCALASVRDPELDDPITELGFIDSLDTRPGGVVSVRLRLPTPQCAPNFAFLMAADARDAIARVPGVRHAVVELLDHYTGREINTALVRGQGFSSAFPGETRGELDALRALFRRKALVARQGRLLATVADPASATLGELSGPDADRCRELRAELGIDARDDAPAFVSGDGSPLQPRDVMRFRRMASLTALSLETNGGMCRDLLRTRYPEATKEVALA